MKKEFIVLELTSGETQKTIRTWCSTGYEIEIIAQNVIFSTDYSSYPILVTSLWRHKK